MQEFSVIHELLAMVTDQGDDNVARKLPQQSPQLVVDKRDFGVVAAHDGLE